MLKYSLALKNRDLKIVTRDPLTFTIVDFLNYLFKLLLAHHEYSTRVINFRCLCEK